MLLLVNLLYIKLAIPGNILVKYLLEKFKEGTADVWWMLQSIISHIVPSDIISGW